MLSCSGCPLSGQLGRVCTAVEAVPVRSTVHQFKQYVHDNSSANRCIKVQEARAAAEAERRQRLLAAAAAAVKQSAPPAPSKQWQKRAAVKPNDRLDSEKRPSSDAAVLRNAGSELHRQGMHTVVTEQLYKLCISAFV